MRLALNLNTQAGKVTDSPCWKEEKVAIEPVGAYQNSWASGVSPSH